MDITPDEDLVTPERLAKGDLEVAYNIRGNVARAIPASLTIVKELIRRGVMPHHFEIYGVAFLELQAVFRAPWAVRKMAGVMEQLGVGVSGSQVDSIYQSVCKRLGKERIAAIEYVMLVDKKYEKVDMYEVYKECFDMLTVVMDEERDRVFSLKS